MPVKVYIDKATKFGILFLAQVSGVRKVTENIRKCIVFHLGTLAADVVDQVALASGGPTAWRLLQRLHAWLAWLMKGPMAIVQLSMLLLGEKYATV